MLRVIIITTRLYTRKRKKLAICTWLMHAESPRNLGRDPRGSRIAIHAELAVGERHFACVCSVSSMSGSVGPTEY